jgi:hypothetical protein
MRVYRRVAIYTRYFAQCVRLLTFMDFYGQERIPVAMCPLLVEGSASFSCITGLTRLGRHDLFHVNDKEWQ